jgi:predicted phage tail protein
MEEKETTVYLTGRLGKKFGQVWKLFVKSPREALQAINTNTKGEFFRYIGDPDANRHYKIAIQDKKNLLTKEEIPNRSGNSDIYIMPAIKGSKAGARIIAGIILIVAAFLMPGPLTASPWAMALFSAGVGLTIGGIVELLTPVPKRTKTDQAQSANFQGNATAAYQGAPVPLVYGKAIVNPIPVCVSTNTFVPAVTPNQTQGTVTTNPLQGGGYQYIPSGGITTPWYPQGNGATLRNMPFNDVLAD